jgi:hypothetical protein
VLGDLGWRVLYVRAVYQAVCLWTRVTDMGDDALLRKAMHVQRQCIGKCGKGKAGLPWLERLSACVCKSQLGLDLWNKWLNSGSFRVETVRIVLPLTGGRPVMKRWEDDVLDEVCELTDLETSWSGRGKCV